MDMILITLQILQRTTRHFKNINKYDRITTAPYTVMVASNMARIVS
jgi:hypothetical protein